MIPTDWPRMAGVHATDGGEMAVAWLAYDRDTDSVNLYDCAIFRREVMAVIAEGVNARGRWIPIAWSKGAKAVSDDLLKRGCRMEYEPVEDDDAMAEITSRNIWERMRTGRFRVDKRLAEWLQEAENFQRADGKIPKVGFPLMTATRIALQALPYGRKHEGSAQRKNLFPKLAVT